MACPLLCHTTNGGRKQKSHRLCDDSQSKSQAKQLRNDFLRTQVNVGVKNTGPMGVVDFWDNVYLKFIESTNNLKPSTVHGYKQVWNQHLKLHFGTTNLTEYKTHMMSIFLTSLAPTLRPRTLNSIKWLASAIFAHAVATGEAKTTQSEMQRCLARRWGTVTPNRTRWNRWRTS